MGDRTAVPAIITACPRAAARYRVTESWGATHGIPDRTYGRPAVACGTAADLRADLGALDGVAFTVWEDPKSEWLRDLWIHVPETGNTGAAQDTVGALVVDGLTHKTEFALLLESTRGNAIAPLPAEDV